jgi:ABC-2 type transport system permease protein
MYALRKFFAYAAVAWQRATVYRGERIASLITETIPLVVMLSLWQFLRETGRLSPVEANTLAVYFILATMFNRLTASYFEDWMSDEIKDGNISIMLVRPMSPQIFLMANELVWRFSSLVYAIPLYLYFVPQYFRAESVTSSVSGILLAIALVVLSFFSRFYVSWIVTITGFWMDKVRALAHFKWMMEGLFGGQWLPLTFFPPLLISIARVLPFFGWYFLPIQLVIGEMTVVEAIPDVGIALVWTFALYVIAQIMWSNALKKYSAVGR